MNEFTELNEADLGEVVGGTGLTPLSGFMSGQIDSGDPTYTWV